MGLKKIEAERITQILGTPPVASCHSEMKEIWEKEVQQLPTKEILCRFKNQDWCEEYRYICYNELTQRKDLEDCYIELNTKKDSASSNLDRAVFEEIEKTISEYSLKKTKLKLTEAECALSNSELVNDSREVWEYIKDLCEYRIENNIDFEEENNQEIATLIQSKKTIHKNSYTFHYIISFLIPLVGFIVGAIMLANDDNEKSSCGKICIILGMISMILSIIIICALLA